MQTQQEQRGSHPAFTDEQMDKIFDKLDELRKENKKLHAIVKFRTSGMNDALQTIHEKNYEIDELKKKLEKFTGSKQ